MVMLILNSVEKFIQAFALRDSLFRVVSLLAGTFTIAAISLLPGFGVKGLIIASSIQLLLSALLELPTSLIADKYGRSVILKLSLFLKLFVSLALGLAIYFASTGDSQWVWYAFFIEAFLDAISNTLLSGSYQVSYLTLYDSVSSPSAEPKPPLFLRSFKYGIKFRILFPIGFAFILVSIFQLSTQFHQNLYFGAYLILSLIILSRIVLLRLISTDFKKLSPKLDRASIGIKDGIKQVLKGIGTQKTIFFTYSVSCLLSFLGTLYLTGQSMKYLPLMNLKPGSIWISAIIISIITYLLRTVINILVLPKLTRDKLYVVTPLIGFLIIISGVVLAGIDSVLNSIQYKLLILILMTVLVFVAFDTIAKFIESSLREILKSEYKATWLSLGNTCAYLVFGILSAIMAKVSPDMTNIIVGVLLAACGFFILTSQLLYKVKELEMSFLDVLRFHLIKLLLFIVCLMVVFDTISYTIIVKNKIEDIRLKTANTVLLGIKSSIIQGNIIEASNFLYSLKSGNFINCFDLNSINTNVSDCSLNTIDFRKSESELVKIEFDGNIYGSVSLHFDFNPLRKDIYLRILTDVIFSLFLYLVLLYVFQLIARVVAKEVNFLHSSLDDPHSETTQFEIREFREIYLRIAESIKLREQIQFQTAMVNVASQVSHDIRSPLSALSLMTSQLSSIPEEKRIIIRSAVNRINDIANDLLIKGKELSSQKTNHLSDNSNHTTAVNSGMLAILLSPLIDSIVSEKRIQFREKQGVEIESDITHGYGLFANINATELKRTISNLVNNAIEAFPNESGKVTVAIRKYGEQAAIIIQDNGKGIPENILKKLGEMGVSHGKEGTQSGIGLGVYHAKKTVEGSGGKFQIQSREGAGTTITLTFSKIPAPKWFVEKLILLPNMTITSLDDDISIHQIWKGRFESKNTSDFGIEHLTFTSGTDFKTWVASQTHDAKSARLYLVDYELLNQTATGLDIVEKLGLGSQAILVTSRYEEDKIRERCERLGVRLIPKAMAGFVPIEITKPRELVDGILLDNDDLVHSCWAIDAISKDKRFVGFYSADDFFTNAALYDPQTKIYVDSNLGNGVKGEVISQEIHKLGFKNIYLCTGYQASQFPPMPWIKEVIGKDPTF
jgi:signal transduction histidine kinase